VGSPRFELGYAGFFWLITAPASSSLQQDSASGASALSSRTAVLPGYTTTPSIKLLKKKKIKRG